MSPSKKRKKSVVETDETAQSLPRKPREEEDAGSDCNEDTGTDEEVDDENKDGNEASPALGTATSAKLKCLNCWRAARKDCTGSLCIRCCTDDTCAVHQEQKARARWREAVTNGTTEIQREARIKKARKIPRGRFKEEAFSYMNDTVVLWDLRTVLNPSPPPQQQHPQPLATTASASTPGAEAATTLPASNSASTSASTSAAYQNEVRVKDEILRRSRRKHSAPRAGGAPDRSTATRRNYSGTKKRFRRLMEDLYQRSLASN
eukprot:jgi/Psemu1/286557/fgenesh1_pg.142_\